MGRGLVREAAARVACLELVHAFNNLVDGGQADKAPALFSDDAEMVSQGLRGIDAIRAALTARAARQDRRTIHLATNLQFTHVGEDKASATWVLCFYLLGEPDKPLIPDMITRMEDDFLRLPSGEWRIRRRSSRVMAGRPA